MIEILLAGFIGTVVTSALMIFATANSKGGVGKTTIAVHLAAWLHEHGFSVTLVDCDPQRSSSEWISEAYPEVRAICMSSADQILEELPGLKETSQAIVVDGPAGLDEISRAILVHCHGVIVPCKAGTLEARALVRATSAIRQVQRIPGRDGLPEAKVVLTMVGERFVLTREMRDAANEIGFPLATAMLPQRQVYALSPGHGKVLWQIGKRGQKAALEMDRFFRELLPGIDEQSPSRIAQLVGADLPAEKARGDKIQQTTRKVANG